MQLNPTNKKLSELHRVYRSSKIWLVMKITVFLVLVTFNMVAANVYSQKINLEMKNAKLEDVFIRIEKISGNSFIYEKNLLKKAKSIDVTLQNATLQDAMNSVLKDQSLDYVIRDKYIVISPKNDSPEPQVSHITTEVPLPPSVTGVVKDTAGISMQSVTIINKTTGKSTVTDAQGVFKIDAKTGDILVFSFVGFVKQTVLIGKETNLKIVLRELVSQLNTVVVTALGIKKSTKSLTYNVQEMSGTEINNVKEASFVNGLAGKVAGVTINSSSSGIGGATRVVMRGSKSLFGNNNALYVIDGVPMPSLMPSQPSGIYSGADQTGDGISNLNPDDIASVSVLTGAAAAALYGSQAANGVIIINTKKGANNETNIEYNNSTSFLSPLILPQFQNTYGASSPGAFDNWNTKKLPSPSTYKPADFFQTGTNVNNFVSVSTGNDKNQTYVSAASLMSKGIIPNNKFGRYNFTARNTSTFLDGKLNLDINFMYVQQNDQNMLAQGQYFNPLIPIYLFPRSDDMTKYQVYQRYDPTRNFQTQYWPYGVSGLSMQNPYWIDNKDIFTNNNDRYLFGAQLKYNINSWLNITGRLKEDNNTNVNEQKLNASTDGLYASPDGYYSNIASTTKQTYVDVLLNLNKTIKSFSINATIGANLQNTSFTSTGYNGNLLTVPNLFNFDNINPNDANHRPQAIQNIYRDESQAVFGTASLSYKSMLFLDMSIRNDWSSALVNTIDKSIYYPSVGISGILSDLLHMDPSVISFMKVRTTYSEVGNAPQRYLSVPTYPVSNGAVNTQTFYVPSTLQPERTKAFEVGLNMRFLSNKINLDVTYYNSNTYNQLFALPAPSTSQYNTIYVNAGQVNNYGVEAMLSVNTNLGPVKWNSKVTFTLNRNKIIELVPSHIDPATGARISLDSTNMSGGTGIFLMKIKKGGSIGDLYATSFVKDGDGNLQVFDGKLSSNPNKYVMVGNTNPDYNIGFRNSFSYKSFNLEVLVDGRFGGVVSSNTQAIMDQYGVSVGSAQMRDNGGIKVNDVLVNAQNFYAVSSSVGSQYIYSATNIRLREVSLGYTMPGKLFKNKIKSLTVAVNGLNLLFFYNHAPYDPESTANTGTYNLGVDYFMQPSLRTIGFSVNAKF